MKGSFVVNIFYPCAFSVPLCSTAVQVAWIRCQRAQHGRVCHVCYSFYDHIYDKGLKQLTGEVDTHDVVDKIFCIMEQVLQLGDLKCDSVI